MEVGLSVIFDGKSYLVPAKGEFKPYPLGGLACELSRLHPTEIKPLIMECPWFHNTDLREQGADALMWLYEAMFDKFGPVIAAIVASEFACYIADFNRANSEELKRLVEMCNAELGSEICQFILNDTGYSEFGASTMGQALLSAYSAFAGTFAAFMVTFKLLVTDGKSDPDRVNAFWSFFTEHIDFQHIDYKILNIEGRFHSVYTLETCVSLILFEAAHAIEQDTKFVKCKNCGCYFVPIGRSDALYCGYPSPQDRNKTCRDLGAQATRARMLKNDIVTQEYRRLYMRLKMAIKRHPDDPTLQQKFDSLTEGMKEKRKKRDMGELNSDDILEWIASLDTSDSNRRK